MSKNYNLKKKKTNLKNYTVIFDSGFGGLSIYKKVKNIFPNINCIYILDNEKFPYGEKTESFILNRSFKIITSITKKVSITMVIIACNTVTITSLTTLKKYFNFPIIGVIPDFIKAIKITKNNIIGLIGTKITINHYHIRNFASFFTPQYKIKLLENNELAKITEEKLKNKPISIEKIKFNLQPLLIQNNIPDTIILGCTHFSFLKEEIRKIFPKKTQIVDSKILITKNIFKILKNSSNNIQNCNIAMFSKKIKKTKMLLNLLNKYDFKKFKKLII